MMIDFDYTNQGKLLNNLLSYMYKNNQKNEIPIAAMIVSNSKIINIAINNTKEHTLHHAEMIAINNSIDILNDKYLTNCDIYSTLEPCPMCAYAISLAKIKNIYFAAPSLKNGALQSTINIFHTNFIGHIPNIYYLENKQYSNILSSYFNNNNKRKS